MVHSFTSLRLILHIILLGVTNSSILSLIILVLYSQSIIYVQSLTGMVLTIIACPILNLALCFGLEGVQWSFLLLVAFQ